MEIKNSNIVVVHRTLNGTPVSDNKNSQVAEWNSISHRYASIRNMSASNHNPYTGLGYTSENKPYDTALELRLKKLFFPELLAMDYTDANAMDFKNKVTQFYDGLSVSVPSGGIEYEIGLTISNNDPVSAENMPLNIMDYIVFKAIFENNPSYIAKSEEEGNGVAYYLFYTVYKSQEESKKLAIAELGSTAQSLYNDVKDTVDVKYILKALKLPYDIQNKTKNSLSLVNFSRDKPSEFINEVNLYKASPIKYKVRDLINDCVVYEIIQRKGNNEFTDIASGFVLGYSEKETIDYLASPANKEQLHGYRNRLLEHIN